MTCVRKSEHIRSPFPHDVSPFPKKRSISVHFSAHFMYIACGDVSNIQYTTMAGRTKEMSQIKQLLLLKKDGVSNRKVAAIVGINKDTVNNYVGIFS